MVKSSACLYSRLIETIVVFELYIIYSSLNNFNRLIETIVVFEYNEKDVKVINMEINRNNSCIWM